MSLSVDKLECDKELHRAIARGDVVSCRQWIAAGSDVNVQLDISATGEELAYFPLARAARKGKLEVCRVLLAAGAQVNAMDEDGDTALHLAACHGNEKVCALLIAAGANVHAANKERETPLYHATLFGHVGVCRLLLDAGCSVHQVDTEQWVPLHSAALRGHLEVCRLLVERGANVHNTNEADDTPLHLAARSNRLATCRVLVELGAQSSFVPYDPATNYRTPFQDAVKQGHWEVVRFFVEACGEDLNQTTRDGQPLEKLLSGPARQAFFALKTELMITKTLAVDAPVTRKTPRSLVL